MGASNGLVDRNSKNRRFLEFRTIFETFTEALRCWKWPKIGWSYFCNSKNMRKYRGNIIFDSGKCLDIKFWNFVLHVMGGALFESQINLLFKKHDFLDEKTLTGTAGAVPPSPYHVCRRSPRPHLIAPSVAWKMWVFHKNEANPLGIWVCRGSPPLHMLHHWKFEKFS